MRKNFLLKILFMLLLVVVLISIVVIMRTRFSVAKAGFAQEQSFFEQFVIAGGPIVWFVLLPMSIITVFLAAQYCLTIRRIKLLPEAISNRIIGMLGSLTLSQLGTQLDRENDFISIAVGKAIGKSGGDWFRCRSILDESLAEQALSLLRRIEWLSLIGNVSPMVGLFGTVFGMIKLFNEIVRAGGQPQPAQLAEGISVALVTTFWGLFIAIPALAIHGVFRNRIETLASEAVTECENILPEIRKSLKNNVESNLEN